MTDSIGVDMLFASAELAARIERAERQLVTDEIPVDLESRPAPEGRWAARVRVALEHLPPAVSRVNAYAIRGVGSARRYLAAFPVPGEQPDFHRLAHFGVLVPRDGALAAQRS